MSSSMNLKEKILFICIGQGGGNIGQLLEDKGYHCLFINTAHADLETLNVKHKLHIAGAYGCNKDRSKAISYLEGSHDIISHGINSRFPDQSIVYFIFTLGGGTGSGLSPALLHIMSEKDSSKVYNAICVIPSLKERSRISKINAVESYQQLVKIESLKSIMVLDNNNSDDIGDINRRFVDRFDRVVNITIPDQRGIIDQSEIETVLTAKGSTYISIIPKGVEGLASGTMNSVNVNVFTPFSNRSKCDYMAVSFGIPSQNQIAGSVDINQDLEDLEHLFGIPNDVFVRYNSNCNLIVASGLPYPTERIKELIHNIKGEIAEKDRQIRKDLSLAEYDSSIDTIGSELRDILSSCGKEELKSSDEHDVIDLSFDEVRGSYVENSERRIIDMSKILENYR